MNSKFEKFKELIDVRIHKSEEDYYYVTLWEKEVTTFSENIAEGIDFIKTECTDEEFYWLSEVFEEIAERTQSKEFIQILRDRLTAVCPENYHQQDFHTEHMRKYIDYDKYVHEVSQEIDYAEGKLDSEE